MSVDVVLSWEMIERAIEQIRKNEGYVPPEWLESFRTHKQDLAERDAADLAESRARMDDSEWEMYEEFVRCGGGGRCEVEWWGRLRYGFKEGVLTVVSRTY